MTPLDELNVKRMELRCHIKYQEKVVNDDLVYIRKNAVSLSISGLSHLLFPARREKQQEKESTSQDDFSTSSGLVQTLIPVLVSLASPALVRLLLRKIKSIFG